MEKIIAVVIMVVIVIGLIATVIMPQQQQVGQMGAATTTQMSQINTAMQNDNVSGTAVRSEFASGNNNNKTVVIIDDDTTDGDATLTIDTTTGLVVMTNVDGGSATPTSTDTIWSDTLNTTASAGQPAGPTVSGSVLPTTKVLASSLSSDVVKPDALYSRTEKTDTNGVRWILFVKQVIAK